MGKSRVLVIFHLRFYLALTKVSKVIPDLGWSDEEVAGPMEFEP